MENLKTRIQSDMNAALKRRDALVVSTLRMVLSAWNYAFIEKGRQLTGEEEIKVLQSEAKKRKESIAAYQRIRPELAEQERQELAVLERYLPKQLSDGELKSLVEGILGSLDVSGLDLGKAMGLVMKQLSGKVVDGARVREMVERILKQTI